jgi:hypothetical protein
LLGSLQKIKYKHLAPAFRITITRTHQLYTQGIQKMKKQMIEKLNNS